MDDLDVIDPAGTSVGYRGERLEVKPLYVGKLPKLVRVGRPVIKALFALVDNPDMNWVERMMDPASKADPVVSEGLPDVAAPAAVTDEMLNLMLDLVADHGDAVFELAAVCVDKPTDWIAKGDIDEFVQLALKIIAVNRDFFRQKLAPLLAGRAR